jgi:anti-sigma B factor antagonist
MPLNVRIDGDVAILSNFGRLLNDPRYFDAGRDVKELLVQGYRKFVLELGGVKEMGATALGLLTTLTRQIRQHGGEAVLAHMNRDTENYINMMQMDSYWDFFAGVEEAKDFFRRSSPLRGAR